MTNMLGTLFDEDVARRADAVTEEAIGLLLEGPPIIRTGQGDFQVVIVAAPAGAGTTQFFC
jgi:hypothetical protein